MPIITFLSDFGYTDHYVAAVKAKILGIAPDSRIIDITHNIEPNNLAQASFSLQSVFREFGSKTIHLIGVNSTNTPDARFVGLELEGHFFLSVDNGLFGLISDEQPTNIVNLNPGNNIVSTFPAKDILAPAAAHLAMGKPLGDIGEEFSDLTRLISRKAKATKSQISGHVIHTDHYGNLITNIKEEDFNILSAGRGIAVKFGRESLNSIHSSYNQVDGGDCCVLFNSLGLLEIGIQNGNASKLLGLNFDSPVTIMFEGG